MTTALIVVSLAGVIGCAVIFFLMRELVCDLNQVIDTLREKLRQAEADSSAVKLEDALKKWEAERTEWKGRMEEAAARHMDEIAAMKAKVEDSEVRLRSCIEYGRRMVANMTGTLGHLTGPDVSHRGAPPASGAKKWKS